MIWFSVDLNDTGESDEKSWTEEFPHMPAKCIDVSALVIGTALVVVGGVKDLHCTPVSGTLLLSCLHNYILVFDDSLW